MSTTTAVRPMPSQGLMVRIMPRDAAMPLPPLNLKNTGKSWPRMAAVPPISRPTSPARYRPSCAAMKDFRQSPTSVSTLGSQPRLRSTLVEPALPLPTLRMSLMP